MSAEFEIQLISVIVAIACSIPGVFLVLRKMSMMTDAITHTILLGIVLAFFVSHSLNSPLLIIGAALMGLVTVFLVEILNKTKLMSEDASVGIVFPFLFSIAIILISRYAGNVHLDVDSVLLGEIAFAPFDRVVLFGNDIGPKALYVMGIILILNISYVKFFYKELKLVTFDSGLAVAIGFSPYIVHYSLMGMVSITAVGAFESVGSILIIAFMIGPPITAYMLTEKLRKMLFLSAFIGALNGILGYQIAALFDVSIAGAMATMTGITFLLVFTFAPKKGLITIMTRRKSQKIEFATMSMLFHLHHHEGTDGEERECKLNTLNKHLHWESKFLNKVINTAKKRNYVLENSGILKLTEDGREYAVESYKKIVESMR